MTTSVALLRSAFDFVCFTIQRILFSEDTHPKYHIRLNPSDTGSKRKLLIQKRKHSVFYRLVVGKEDVDFFLVGGDFFVWCGRRENCDDGMVFCFKV